MYVETGKRVNWFIGLDRITDGRSLAAQGEQVEYLQIYVEGIVCLTSEDLKAVAIGRVVKGVARLPRQFPIVGRRFAADIGGSGQFVVD